jgi:hypothetical protein
MANDDVDPKVVRSVLRVFFGIIITVGLLIIGGGMAHAWVKWQTIHVYGDEIRKTIIVAGDKGVDLTNAIKGTKLIDSLANFVVEDYPEKELRDDDNDREKRP